VKAELSQKISQKICVGNFQKQLLFLKAEFNYAGIAALASAMPA